VRAAAAELSPKLAQQAEQVHRLQATVSQQEQKERTLAAQVREYLNAGQREAAQRTVLELEHVRELLKENRAQWEETQRLYEEVRRIHAAALDEVRRQEERMAHCLTRTETMRGQQELAEVADKQLRQIAAASQRLERTQRDLDAQAVKTQVHAEVSTEVLSLSDAAAKQTQQQIHAETLLSEFEAEERRKGRDS
jgi:hypothetical protein